MSLRIAVAEQYGNVRNCKSADPILEPFVKQDDSLLVIALEIGGRCSRPTELEHAQHRRSLFKFHMQSARQPLRGLGNGIRALGLIALREPLFRLRLRPYQMDTLAGHAAERDRRVALSALASCAARGIGLLTTL